MQLRATDSEKRDLGGALAEAISYFEDASPFVKLLNWLGPWAGLIDGLADSIYNRVVYVAEHRRQPGAPFVPPAVTTPSPAGNGRAYYEDDARGDDDVIYAPDPGRATG